MIKMHFGCAFSQHLNWSFREIPIHMILCFTLSISISFLFLYEFPRNTIQNTLIKEKLLNKRQLPNPCNVSISEPISASPKLNSLFLSNYASLTRLLVSSHVKTNYKKGICQYALMAL